MKHVRVNNANIEPVFFAYPDNQVLDALIIAMRRRLPSTTSSPLSTVSATSSG